MCKYKISMEVVHMVSPGLNILSIVSGNSCPMPCVYAAVQFLCVCLSGDVLDCLYPS